MNRDAIARDWIAASIRAYPAGTSRFLEREGDPFRNPIGRAYREGLPILVDAVLGQIDIDRAASVLDDIVRIRAVQDFSPTQMLDFLPALKAIVRAQPVVEVGGADSADRLAAIEARIDCLTAVADRVYATCRAQIADIRRRTVHPSTSSGRTLSRGRAG